jgi:hypothetical protein
MIHPKLLPLIQLVEYSPKFTGTRIWKDSLFTFKTKNPITKEPSQHIGEHGHFEVGFDNQHNMPYVVFSNSGDDNLCASLKEFIDYINIK